MLLQSLHTHSLYDDGQDTLARMAQNFTLRVPLVDGQGNFGSADGDAPAAMRYTECRLSKAAAELLNELDRGTVDFKSNYDGDKEEPRLKAARAHIAFDPEPENQDLVVVPQASLDAPPRRMRWGR